MTSPPPRSASRTSWPSTAPSSRTGAPISCSTATCSPGRTAGTCWSSEGRRCSWTIRTTTTNRRATKSTSTRRPTDERPGAGMIDARLAPLQFEFGVRALLAAALVGVVCAVVGSYMVLRGLAFMGDAISHAAFPGVVMAYLFGGSLYLGGAIAAVATALGIGWISRRAHLRSDTIIGVLFAGMFGLGVAIYSAIPNYVGDLFGFLFGDVLGILSLIHISEPTRR